MPAIRTCVAVVVLLFGLTAATGQPTPAQIDRWVEDLSSADTDTWRAAVDRLWKAGKAAEPAVRAAMKHADPDVRLRARLVLGRFDWGIYPDTPAGIAQAIERYKSGDRNQQKSAIDELVKQGRAGHAALRKLLDRETDAALRKLAAEHLKRHSRPLVRDLLAAGQRAEAEAMLETSATAGNQDAERDLAALWALTGQTKEKAGELERLAAAGDQKATRLGVLLHRAAGDLAAAGRLASKGKDRGLLADIQDEQEDYKALARGIPDNPWGVAVRAAPAKLAVLMHRGGDRDGCEAALGRLASAPGGQRATALFFTDRPRQAIEAYRGMNSPSALCALLATQGRRAEALAVTAGKEDKDADQRAWLLFEQAVVTHGIGEKEKALQLLDEGIQAAGKSTNADSLLGAAVRAGARMSQRDEAVTSVARLLDRLKPFTPRQILNALSTRDGEAMALWWDFLRKKSPDTPPSATLALLRAWFERGQADKDFDALLAQAQRVKPATPADAELDRWPSARARACVAVGKVKKAEEILQARALALKNALVYLRVGDFHFERKQWALAAAQYGKAVERESSNHLALYLQGVALKKAGQEKEGQVLVDRARLMPLADETERYNLAQGLTQRGLADEAEAVWLILVRTAPFRSIYTTNGAVQLANRAATRKQFPEAARYFRRVFMNLALGGGAFVETAGYLRVPAVAHLNECRGLLAAGKLDAALVEGKLALEYLPEEITIVIDLVHTFDRAGRKADADRLFEEVFPRHQKACADFPKAAACHNRLAWLAVRCGRQLDRALRHAGRAVELTPEVPGYLDTLAEVHFQRGDKTAALTAIKRALKLAPSRAYYAAQLKRIEAGDRTAEVPEE